MSYNNNRNNASMRVSFQDKRRRTLEDPDSDEEHYRNEPYKRKTEKSGNRSNEQISIISSESDIGVIKFDD